jgi:hypothetical protein
VLSQFRPPQVIDGDTIGTEGRFMKYSQSFAKHPRVFTSVFILPLQVERRRWHAPRAGIAFPLFGRALLLAQVRS